MSRERATRRSSPTITPAAKEHARPTRVRAGDLATARGAGRPLDHGTRDYMESRFGHDFSHVRVHTDATADESARDVGARAYTVGSDIAFRAGRYAPGTADGRALLGHELAHVVQQERAGGAVGEELAISRPSDGAEREAAAVGESVAAGAAVQVQAASAPAVQRDAEGEDDHFWNSPVFKGIATAAGFLPGVGGVAKILNSPFAATRAMEGATQGDPVKGIANTLSFFSSGMGGIAALGGYSALGTGGLGGLVSTLGAEGLGALGTVGGLGTSAGLTMPASAALTGGGLSGAAALGPAAAVLGAGAAGMAVGSLIAEHTGVDEAIGDGLFDVLGPEPGLWLADHLPSWLQ